jgi:hypothetical protein
MRAEKVDNILLYVLGERDFPLAPVAKLRGDLVAPIGELVLEAQKRLPDVGHEDLLKVALRIGLAQIPKIYAADGRIERGGGISFTPLKEGRRAAELTVKRTKLAAAGVLDGGLNVGDREAFEPPVSQAPKDTIPNPQVV